MSIDGRMDMNLDREQVPLKSTDFVGRQGELEQLRRLMDGIHSGKGGATLLVHGEAGIGKTRLLEELATIAQSKGFETHWATAWEGEGAPAFWPWIQIIRSFLDHQDQVATAVDLGPEGADIARLLPAAGRFVKERSLGADSEQARFRLFDAVGTFLARAASSRRLLLVFDDLHWADRASLTLASFISSQTRTVPILLAASYRDERPEFETNLPRFPSQTLRVHLRGLSFPEVQELAVLRRPDVDDVFINTLYERTTGNPLFVSEFLQLAVSEIDSDLPAGIRGVLEERLESLEPETRSLLTEASVLGREIKADDLAQVAGVGTNRITSALMAAKGHGVLVAGTAPNSYSFSHSLIGGLFYEQLGDERRAELHARVAHLLEAHEDEFLAELAHHYSRAGHGAADKAAEYCERAGVKAFGMLAYEGSSSYFEKALDAIASGDPGNTMSVRIRLLLRLGEAQSLAGWSDASRTTFRHASDLARELSDPDSFAQAALGFGRRLQFAGIAGADTELLELLDEALQISGVKEDLTVRLLCRLAYELSLSDRTRSRDLIERAQDLSDRIGDPSIRLVVLERLHGWKVGQTHPSERLPLADEMIRIALDLGDSERELQGRIWRVVDLVELGDFSAVRADVDAFTKRAERMRLRTYFWYPALWNAMQALLAGRLDQGAELASTALYAGSSWGRIASDHFGLQAFVIAWERGELESLIAPLIAAVEAYPSVAAYRCALAIAYLETGKDASARNELSQLAADNFSSLPADFNRLISLALCSEICASLGDAHEAETLYELFSPHEGLFAWAGYATICFGSVHRFLGALASKAGRPDDAERHFELALLANAAAGAGPALARTRFEYASMLLDRGSGDDRGRATSMLEEALNDAGELGLGALKSKIESFRPPYVAVDVFRREGAYWTIGFEGGVARMKDSKGLRDIARLLAHPGREVHVAELISADASFGTRSLKPLGSLEKGMPLIDARAHAQYRRRLEELQVRLEEAEANSDLAAAANARAEMDFLAAHLASALGLGGRPRHAGDPAERARKAVTERIRNAIKRMEAHHPALARHLTVSVKTGTFCSYSPEKAVAWEL